MTTSSADGERHDVATTPRSGPPAASSPRSMPCWIATGTATRPAIETIAKASVPASPVRSSGESASPRRTVRRIDSSRSGNPDRRRCSPRHLPLGLVGGPAWPPARPAPAGCHTRLAPLRLRPLVGGDQLGVSRGWWRAAPRACRGRPPGRAPGRPPRRRARWWPAGTPPPGSTAVRRSGAQPGQDRRLHPRVDRAGGVVQDQQPRPAGQGPGQREPLPLTAGQAGAALPTTVSSPSGRPRRTRRPAPAAAPARPRRRRCRAGPG